MHRTSTRCSELLWFGESAIFYNLRGGFCDKGIGSLLFALVSQVYQEQTVAGETTQNIVGFHPVQDQEIPEVQVIERIQEQIGSERIEEQIGDILVPQIVEDTVEVVHIFPQELLQHQEQIITGEAAQNIVGFHSVPGQVKVQEFPEVQVSERIQEQIVPER